MGKLRKRLGIGDPQCRWCKEEEETVEHVNTSCNSLRIFMLKQELKVVDVAVLLKEAKLGLTFCTRALSLLR